jgi:hypothetical protein
LYPTNHKLDAVEEKVDIHAVSLIKNGKYVLPLLNIDMSW